MNIAAQFVGREAKTSAKPFLKWAGGKTQLLNELSVYVPNKFNRYIEPFIGGGAMFFSLNAPAAVIGDSNPELVNVYQCLRDNADEVIEHLKKFKTTEKHFYEIRRESFAALQKSYAAARTIYLNRTCYNGLYRVNKMGEFNVPFGRYTNPSICNEEVLLAAASVLGGVEIICSDYKDILRKTARAGDFIFLDPPYLPVSQYSDFKRYTKERFHEEDHRDLATEIERLQRLGCHVILTNSNHPLVHDLYAAHEIRIVSTKRNISSATASRRGEDVIVNVKPFPRCSIRAVPEPVDEIAASYPSTRYMGSKEKLLPYIKDVARNFEFDSVLDLFSGSGVVGYMFKGMGKQVFSNDYMAMSATFAHALIENNIYKLNDSEIDNLFVPSAKADKFVQEMFGGLYYSNSDNAMIDIIRSNIKVIENPHKRALAMAALIRACLKKRARGIFTYTGLRYDDGRIDLKLDMETQVRNAIKLINDAVFDNGKENTVRHGDAMSAQLKADLTYIDPPYYSPLSDNEYVRRYHFVEGLARDWRGIDLQMHTKTRKFKSYPTPFNTHAGATDAFDRLFKRLRDSILLVSYSSNSLPTKEIITSMMAKYKNHVEVIDIDHRYSFANQRHKITDSKNQVKEYLFVGY